jgi:hypothetical protein
MGKLNVTPRGMTSWNSPGQAEQPSFTTSAIRLPIQANRSSAWLFFNCSPMGHDFSSSLMTRDPLPEASAPCPFCCPGSAFAGPRSWMKPTRRFVPPLVILGPAEPHPKLKLTCRWLDTYWLVSTCCRSSRTPRMHCSEK